MSVWRANPKMTSRKTLALALALAMGLPGLRAQVPEDCYRIETIKTPKEMAPEVSAVAFSRQGRLYASLRRGTIWSMDPPQRQWSPFASGLFWPLGILAGEEGELFVAQIPELTRVVDTDGDGRADLYETICDSWGLSGNYHEFVAGPVRDAEGNFYVALGCASSGGAIHPPFRGEPSPKRRTGKLYGHHSPVPYRGWIVKISPDGEMTPLACGFRQANGLVFNSQGARLNRSAVHPGVSVVRNVFSLVIKSTMLLYD